VPARLLLVRHGQSTWNAEGRWQGWADPPLSPRGERQALEAATRLVDSGIETVVASDLQRAWRTAELIAEHLGLGPVTVDQALRERNVGEWCGLTRGEIAERWPGELRAYMGGRSEAIPGGESDQALAARGLEALSGVARSGGRVLVVTHGGLVRAVERALGADASHVPNLAGRWFSADGDGRLVPAERVSLADPMDATTSPSA
jgi:broad specificity phosphatase PhoE